jgi:hypothetical protein
MFQVLVFRMVHLVSGRVIVHRFTPFFNLVLRREQQKDLLKQATVVEEPAEAIENFFCIAALSGSSPNHETLKA